MKGLHDVCFDNIHDLLFDRLGRPVYDENVNESLWNDKCDYLNIEDCINLNPKNYNMNILQLNVRSLLAHQSELKSLLQQLSDRNSSIDIIALSETFLTEKVLKLVDIPGYILHSVCWKQSKGGGVSLLLRHGVRCRQRKDLEEFCEKESEHIFVEITSKCGKKIVVGSSYRAPNMNPDRFKNHLINVIKSVQSRRSDKEIILCMDHNMDLLTSHQHESTREFIDSLLELNIFLTITRPTRITPTSATLIDNVFVSSKLHHSLVSCIIISDISDHLPTLTLLKQTRLTDARHLEFESHNLNENKIQELNTNLQEIDWNGHLTSNDVSENFNRLHTIIKNTLDAKAPKRTVRISKKRKFTEPWMTTAIEEMARKKRSLYKRTLKRYSTKATKSNTNGIVMLITE